ncbi:MAG: hypothetical protein DRQ40_06455 [Gammaproteobacteria bacterium]|nr:MAG: hypothetical protein DRQ40_06455 [Gammaproteobacteria bacterium]
MSIKNLSTIKPVRYKLDKKGNKIAIFRGGITHTNKYDKKTPKELEREANMNNPDYKPEN